VEQQYLYKGDFTVFVRELTNEGCIVQDSVTGVLGFVPREHYFNQAPFPGAIIQGAMCTAFDINGVVISPDATMLRMQIGIVYEWDEALGEGYIIPEEKQGHRNMLRVLRRDVKWHGMRRLMVGQYVTFETCLPGEVPIDANDDRKAPFALRVRSPEVHFSFKRSFNEPPEDAGPTGRYLSLGEEKAPSVPYLDAPKEFREKVVDAEKVRDRDQWREQHEAIELRRQRQQHVMPVESGRPVRVKERESHPVLLRWMEQPSPATRAESPAWLWEAPLQYEDQEADAPIIPIQVRAERTRYLNHYISQHEVAMARGDTWQEPAARRFFRRMLKIKPKGTPSQQAVLSIKVGMKRLRAKKREVRLMKLREASVRRLKRQQEKQRSA
jgi:hypothetical protein